MKSGVVEVPMFRDSWRIQLSAYGDTEFDARALKSIADVVLSKR